MVSSDQAQGQAPTKAQQRAAQRKQFISNFLKKDRFINAREDHFRLMVNEEQELYDFLQMMDKVLLGSDEEQPEFVQKAFQVSETGDIYLEGTLFNLSDEPTPELEEVLWLLARPENRHQVTRQNRTVLTSRLVAVIDKLAGLEKESHTDQRRHSLASIAALALFSTSSYWNDEILQEVKRLAKNSTFALVRSIMNMGIQVVAMAKSGKRVEHTFARGRARERFKNLVDKGGAAEQQESVADRRRNRRRSRRTS